MGVAVPTGFQEDLIRWGRSSSRTFPWRKDPSPYEILVAEILLQATFAEKVTPVYEKLLEDNPEPGALSKASESELVSLLRPLGLQQRKASWLISMAEYLATEGVPTTFEEISNLDGIGRYGANAVLCFGFGERRPIVDTNVIRIYDRVCSEDFSDTEDPRAWEFAERALPEKRFEEYNLALLDLGAEVCTSQNPACESCPVNGYCAYYESKSDD